MCGIFAYVNHQTPKTLDEILKTLLSGLSRLELRGCDSAGVAFDLYDDDGDCAIATAKCPGKMLILKSSGKVEELKSQLQNIDVDFEDEYSQHIGIAHTRWATHGPVSTINSHPHTSGSKNEFVVIHNGVISNCDTLRKYLVSKGYSFESDTDTECIPLLLHYIWKQTEEKEEVTLVNLVEKVMTQLEGTFAIVVKSAVFPTQLVAARRGSPLLLGVKSSSSATLDHIPVYNQQMKSGIIFLEDGDLASIVDGSLMLQRVGEDERREFADFSEVEVEIQQLMKGDYPTFMIKEIKEQPETIVNVSRGRVNYDESSVVLGGLSKHIGEIKRSRRIVILGCGTSYHAAIAARQLIEEMSDLPVTVDVASDFVDRSGAIYRDDVVIFVSQSGETADTLSALNYAKKRGCLLVGITNTVGSTISRETDCGIHCNAGQEIGVASTKTFSAQFTVLVLFALLLSEGRFSKRKRYTEILQSLKKLPAQISETLELEDQCKKIAELWKDKTSVLMMARGYNFANVLEGALKLKEVANLFAEGILTGELKHGPLALVEHGLPMLMIVCDDNTFDKCMNAVQQVTARGGNPVIICDRHLKPKLEKFSQHLLLLPETTDCLKGLLSVVPLQLLAYHVATLRGHNVIATRLIPLNCFRLTSQEH
ncbi:unnamed protein product [Oikopleura dioica]|uniref:glutamine--fructose-6-phosphate transaminase (isomerizing) n=1 Tax=Oikopleura dioica TaxID=34765 RepID=E4WR48_OIKDI|nr:unnamed protein product [Oikopleura dioica]